MKMVTLNHNRFQARFSDRISVWGGVRKRPLFAFLVPHFSARVVMSGKPWSKRKSTTALTHQTYSVRSLAYCSTETQRKQKAFTATRDLDFFFFSFTDCAFNWLSVLW